MSDQYDVILFGIRGEGDESEQAKRKIAELLELDPSKIDEALQSHTGLVIHNGVSMDVAKKLQTGLAKVGGICNLRPAKSSLHRLELVPMEVKEEKPTFECPACGFKEEFENPEDVPQACPSCGVVPDKYAQVQDEKAERERIKKRLLEAHRAREQQGADEYERRQAEARRMQLEEEIRKELGLPRTLTTRGRLISTAAALWVTGVAMGIGLLLTYQMLTAPLGPPTQQTAAARPATPQPGISPEALAAQMPMGGIPPNQELAMQMASFVQTLPEVPEAEASAPLSPEATSTPAPSAVVASDTGELTITGAAAPVSKSILDASALWTAHRDDPAWEHFLGLAVTRQLAAKQVDKASALARAMPDGIDKWSALLEIADHVHHLGDPAKRNKLLDDIEAIIVATPSAPLRVAGLGLLSQRLNGFGELKRAGDAERKAEKLASETPLADGKVAAQGMLAWHQLASHQDAKAERSWRDANRALAGIKDPASRLENSIELASSYARAGKRAEAVGILAGTINLAGRIGDAGQRATFFDRITRAFAASNDVDAAVAAASRQPSAEARDKSLVNAIAVEVNNGEPYLALELADALQGPVYQALGRTAAAWSLKTEKQLHGFADDNLNRALKALDKVTLPADQAVARAVISHYLAWLQDMPKAAEDMAKAALDSATRIDGQPERNKVLAVVATEVGKGQMISLSHDGAAQIIDPDLTKSVTDELAQLLQVSENLR
jgi:hypothetical protein